LAVRVEVIVNRRARHLVNEGGLRRVLIEGAEGRATVHETRSKDELTRAVASIHRRGTDAVILAGGDGSYMAGTTALFHAFGAAMPRVGFAPGGTVSTVARNWGLRGAEAAYAARIVRVACEGAAPSSRRPTLRVQDDRGGDRVGFIFGAGLVARFFEAYYAGGRLGYAAAAALVARVFAGSFRGGGLAARILAQTPAVLIVDGERKAPLAFSLVAASVVKDLGLHMRLLYRAAERPDRFHLVASSLSASKLGPQMPRVLVGRRLSGDEHVDTLARRAELTFTEDSSSAYVLDGDLFPASRVTVSPGPVLDYLSG
jgi:diacylglycerol kinase family enzyme